MKKKTGTKILVAALAAAMAFSSVGAAPVQRTEPQRYLAASTVQNDRSAADENAVYVMTDESGKAEKLIVTDSIVNVISESKGQAGALPLYDSDGNRLSGAGLDDALPISLKVTYYLDGKEIKPEKLAGKSGRLRIRFDYENLQFIEKEINGKTEKIYVPFAVMTGMLLDNEKFSNVQVSSGRAVSDGSHTVVVGLALPGLQENMDIDRELLDIPEFVEVTADVKDFELSLTLTAVTGDVFEDAGLDELYDLDDLTGAFGQLNSAMEQLMSGSSQLYDGLCTLLASANTLSDGVGQLTAGLAELDANSAALNNGAYSVFSSLLAMANKQISDAGLEISQLTVENYAEVLDGLIASLDENAVYDQALKQVTEAVMAQTGAIREGVTAAVRENVEAQVRLAVEAQTRETVEAAVREHEEEIRGAVTERVRSEVTEKVREAAREQVLEQILATFGKTRDDYEKMNALEKGLVDKAVDGMMRTDQVQNEIAQNVEAQMQSGEVQAIIEENVENVVAQKVEEQMQSDKVKAKMEAAVSENTEAQMQSSEVQATIDAYTENKIKELIAENMASDAVQSQLQAAAEGAKSVIELKASLDSYGSFYYGLLSYTAGVSTAAAGAERLNANMPALLSGINELTGGSKQLSEGIIRFNDEGIGRLTGLLDGSVSSLNSRLQASADAAEGYLSHSAIGGLDGAVSFIYRTASIG